MKQHKKNQLVSNYLELMFQIGSNKIKFTEEEFSEHVENFLRIKAAQEKVIITQLIDNISSAALKVRRMLTNNFLDIEEKFTLKDIDRSELQQYRYKITSISKIHEFYTGQKLSRQSVNDHKKNKLKTVKLPDEYTSVLESDLINYLRVQANIKVEPDEKLREFAYRKPLKEEA